MPRKWKSWKKRTPEFKERALKRMQEETDLVRLAKELSVSVRTVYRWKEIQLLGRVKPAREPKPPEKKLREWLAQAGYYDDAAPTVYVGAQLGCAGQLGGTRARHVRRVAGHARRLAVVERLAAIAERVGCEPRGWSGVRIKRRGRLFMPVSTCWELNACS